MLTIHPTLQPLLSGLANQSQLVTPVQSHTVVANHSLPNPTSVSTDLLFPDLSFFCCPFDVCSFSLVERDAEGSGQKHLGLIIFHPYCYEG